MTSSEPGGTPTLNDLAHLIENSPKPVVAALTGACLGGGMELALSSHYRVADPSLRYGLPEVKIGLIPGAGGTQRLPRAIGVKRALDAIVRGRMISVKEGLESGFLDGVVSTERGESVVECAVRWAGWVSNFPTASLDARRLGRRSVPADEGGMENGDMCDFALQNCPPKGEGGESARACVEAIRASFDRPTFAEGMAVEKELFNDLLYHSLQGRAYRHVFFAERSSGSASGGTTFSSGNGGSIAGLIKGKGSIGVIGAGTMGRGIAISFLRAGYGPVTLVDVQPNGLKAGVAYIQSTIKADAKKGRMSQSKAEGIISHLQSATDLSALADCDLIVEAAFENLKVKREIFTKLDAIVSKPDALLLSNTSTLDVDAIASSLRPEKRPYCAGMHFFSPAHIMKLVEVVRGSETSPEVLGALRILTKRIRKVPVVVGNCDGFVGNRMIHPYTTESTLMLVEYGADAGLGVEDVDAALDRRNFGMAIGPFVMSDVAGNDIGYNIRREKGLVRDPETGITGPNRIDGMRYTEMGDEMVEKYKRVGQKAGKGWYDYDPKVGKGRKPISSAEMQSLIESYAKSGTGQKLSAETIVARVLFPLVNEGFKILEEGVADDPGDIDVIYLYGYGFPAHKGGPMFWADNYIGLPRILSELNALYRAYPGSEYFRPSNLLVKCVAAGLGVQEYYRRGLMRSGDGESRSKL